MHIYFEHQFCTIKVHIFQKQEHFQSYKISKIIVLNFREKAIACFQSDISLCCQHSSFCTMLWNFVPYSFNKFIKIHYIFILYFLSIHFPKYTHVSLLLGTIPWDREHTGVMLFDHYHPQQQRIANEIVRSSRKQNKMKQNRHQLFLNKHPGSFSSSRENSKH